MTIGTCTLTGKKPPCSPRQYPTNVFTFFRCLLACDMTSRMGRRSSTLRGKSLASQHRAVILRGLASFSGLRGGFDFKPGTAPPYDVPFPFPLHVGDRSTFCAELDTGPPKPSSSIPSIGYSSLAGRAVPSWHSSSNEMPFFSSSSNKSSPFAAFVDSACDSISSRPSCPSSIDPTGLNSVTSAWPSPAASRYSVKVPWTRKTPARVTSRFAINPDASHTSASHPSTFSFLLPPSHPFTGLNFTSSVLILRLVLPSDSIESTSASMRSSSVEPATASSFCLSPLSPASTASFFS
mmetsp:Transcript_1606/g.2543  ORF Transcript_1606/g.2543 Transcript_1606/m.2543 type:complete len:294 (+) Transcript_1606:735-1616(+)